MQRLDQGDESILVIDVRSAQEYADGHVPGAVNIPHGSIASHLDALRAVPGRQIVLYCESGRRAGMAAQTLQANGFDRLLQLEGHMQQWRLRQQQ